MAGALRAVVIGAGLAGEGHSVALQSAGVTVCAICSRTADVVAQVAKRLGIPQASTDWRQTLTAERPDIVALATPGSAHTEQIETALALGCHVYCDKPLALTAADARRLYTLAQGRGVRAALAATWMYDPGILYLKELVAAGAIGRPLEAESHYYATWPRLVAATWMNRLAEGGGLLNNRLPHQLAAVLHVLGGAVLEVMGEARVRRERFPNLGHLHDFRHRRALSPDEVEGAAWETVDGEDAFTVLLRLGAPGLDPARGITACLRGSGVMRAREDRSLTIYGEEGTLHYATPARREEQRLVQRASLGSGGWKAMPVPERILKVLPPIVEELQRNWAALAREFVADIRGEPHAPYPTFRQGWIFQEIVEGIRLGAGWRNIPQEIPAAG